MRLKQVQALVLDVDGVLTDGGIYISDGGAVMKRFDVKDGLGIVTARKAGIRVALVTLEGGSIAEARAKKLGISDVYTGVEDKLQALRHFLKKYNLKARDVLYMGDDLSDLLAMGFVGTSAAPRDAHPQARRAADVVTKARGGHGAVREIIDAILKARADSGR